MAGKAQPPASGNTNLAIPGTIAISFLFALALFLYGLRLHSRIRPTFKLSAADYTISVAVVRTHRHLVGVTLTSLIDMRIDRIYHYHNRYKFWLRALQLLHFRRRSDPDPEMCLCSSIFRFFDSSHRENVNRSCTAQVRIVHHEEGDHLGVAMYPACHSTFVYPRYAPSVPPNTCLLGARARRGLLV